MAAAAEVKAEARANANANAVAGSSAAVEVYALALDYDNESELSSVLWGVRTRLYALAAKREVVVFVRLDDETPALVKMVETTASTADNLRFIPVTEHGFNSLCVMLQITPNGEYQRRARPAKGKPAVPAAQLPLPSAPARVVARVEYDTESVRVIGAPGGGTPGGGTDAVVRVKRFEADRPLYSAAVLKIVRKIKSKDLDKFIAERGPKIVGTRQPHKPIAAAAPKAATEPAPTGGGSPKTGAAHVIPPAAAAAPAAVVPAVANGAAAVSARTGEGAGAGAGAGENESAVWPVFEIAGLLKEKECAALNSFLSEKAYAATANEYPKEYRNSKRQIIDSEALARELLWPRLRQHLRATDVAGIRPSGFARGGVWVPVAVSPFLRVSRYEAGELFARHRDVGYCRDELLRSVLSVVIYLHTPSSGGDTVFWADPTRPDVATHRFAPAVGNAVVFHHDVEHCGDTVLKGSKVILRADIMFHRYGYSMAELEREKGQVLSDPLFYHVRYLYRESVLASQTCRPVQATDFFLQSVAKLAGTLPRPGEDAALKGGPWTRVSSPVLSIVAVFLGARAVGTCLARTSRWFARRCANSALWRALYRHAFPRAFALERATLTPAEADPALIPYSVVYRQRLARHTRGVVSAFLDIGSHTVRVAFQTPTPKPPPVLSHANLGAALRAKAAAAAAAGDDAKANDEKQRKVVAVKEPDQVLGVAVPNVTRFKPVEVDRRWSYVDVTATFRFEDEQRFVLEPVVEQQFGPIFSPKSLRPPSLSDFLRFTVRRAAPSLSQHFGSGDECPPVHWVIGATHFATKAVDNTRSAAAPAAAAPAAAAPAAAAPAPAAGPVAAGSGDKKVAPARASVSDAGEGRTREEAFLAHFNSCVRTIFGPMSDARLVDPALLIVASQPPAHSAVVVHAGRLALNDSVTLVTNMSVAVRQPIAHPVHPPGAAAAARHPVDDLTDASVPLLMHEAGVQDSYHPLKPATLASLTAVHSAQQLDAIAQDIAGAVRALWKSHPASAALPVMVCGSRAGRAKGVLASLLAGATIVDAGDQAIVRGASNYINTFAL